MLPSSQGSLTSSPTGDAPMRCLAVGVVFLGFAAVGLSAEPVKHRILFAEYGKSPNRLVEVDADGRVVWEYAFPAIAAGTFADHALTKSLATICVLDDR